MITYGTVWGILFPVFLLIGLGFFLRRTEILTPEADRSLVRAVIFVFYPCLIFQNILGNQALLSGETFFLAPVLGFGAVVLGFLVAWPIALVLFPGSKVRQRTFIFCLGIFNYGYLPIPLMQGLFHPDSVGVLLVFNVGVEMALWTVGIFILAGGGLKGAWRKLINPPLIAMVTAMVWNFTVGPEWFPLFLSTLIGWLAACSIPLGLLVSGCMIADFYREIRFRDGLRTLGGACLGRLLIIPALFLAMVVVLPLNHDLSTVLVVQAAMPAGVFPMVITRMYQGDTKTAILIVVGTTAASLFLIPLWLTWGMRLLGSGV